MNKEWDHLIPMVEMDINWIKDNYPVFHKSTKKFLENEFVQMKQNNRGLEKPEKMFIINLQL
jgi:hypothetical protein